MAEGLLLRSAGTHPVGLNPGGVAAMQELQIDISALRSKRMDEFLDQPFDYVITVCDRAKQLCPRWPQTGRLIRWSFEDPAATVGSPEEQRKGFRTVWDQIQTCIEEFLSTGS